MSQKMKITKKLAFLWLILCFCGKAFQDFRLGDQYFSYEINTNVRLLFKKQIVTPSATICFEPQTMVKWESMSMVDKEKLLDEVIPLEDAFDGDESETATVSQKALDSLNLFSRIQLMSNFIDKFSISYIFNNTLSYHEVFSQNSTIGYKPESNDYANIPFDDYFKVTTYMRDLLKCFALEVKPQYLVNLDYKKLKRQPSIPFLLNSVTIPLQILSRVKVYYYWTEPRGKFSQGGLPSYLRMETSEHQVVGLSYEQYEERLLPPPFDTDCRNYSEGNGQLFKSQDDCFEQCFRRESLATTGHILPGVLIFPSDSSPLIPYFKQILEQEVNNRKTNQEVPLKTLFNELLDVCENECIQRDCLVTTFLPRQTAFVKRDSESGFTIDFYVSPSPVTEADFLQQYSWTQFVTDIIATSGFWLGFSALGASDSIKRIGKTLVSAFLGEKQKKIRVQPETLQQHRCRIRHRD